MPSAKLLEVHFRFTKAVRWLEVSKIIERTARSRRTTTLFPTFNPVWPLSGILTRGFLSLWRTLPNIFWLQIYKGLHFLGQKLYQPSARNVQRLPFNLYLKQGPPYTTAEHVGEFRALQLVQKYTSIPVPSPIDLISTSQGSYMITSRMPGTIIGQRLDLWTDEDFDQMVLDLRKYIAELRTIPNPYISKYSICNAVGEACIDWRLNGGATTTGPYENEEVFNDSLRIGILPDLVHRSDHKIVFTHGDISMRNILVEDGRISGIVDWETAGWLPEYWEYIKCHYIVKRTTRWLDVVDRVFEGKYLKELDIERQYWDHVSPW